MEAPPTDEVPGQSCPACGATLEVAHCALLANVTCAACGTPVQVNATVDHYELVAEVGRGGMGVVYKALDTRLDRHVALKLLRTDRLGSEAIAQLETEAAITASINHPHVVQVFTTGMDRSQFYIAMELVSKGTLDDLIRLQGRVAEAQALEVTIQVAEGLRAAHSHGLIHRDVKPGNILFADRDTAKIVDFGLAMIEEAAQEGGGEVWGTPYYVAPEKLDGQPEDFRSDIYSLGATMFHALSGRPPFEAEDASHVALKHLKNQAVSLQAFAPWVSGATAYIINKTLNKDPDERYASYDELIEHLDYARTALLEAVAQPVAARRVVLESVEDQKRWSYVTFGMLALMVAGAGAAWAFYPRAGGARAKAATAATSAAATLGAHGKPAQRYEAARALLLAGNFAEASGAFRMLAGEKSTPAPLDHWCLAHEGLSELLAGRAAEARAAFHTLADRDLPAADSAGKAQAAFFRDLGRLASDENATPVAAAKDFAPSGTGALALLVLGLKNWEAGLVDEGGALLRQFHSSQPAGDAAWVRDYKALVADRLADFADYRGAVELAKTATMPQEIADTFRKLKLDRKRSGKFAARIDAISAEFIARAESRQRELIAQRDKRAETSDSFAFSKLTSADIGLEKGEPAGTTAEGEVAGAFAITAAGHDIWDKADSFRFVHRGWKGDGELVARIDSIEQKHDWSKAGIMFRDGTGAGAKNVLLCYAAANGVSFQVRKEANSDGLSIKDGDFRAPCWLRLVRSGNMFTGFASIDGLNWKQIGSDTVELPDEARAGLAVTSHVIGTPAEAKVSEAWVGR